jgi:dihydrofolate reductase
MADRDGPTQRKLHERKAMSSSVLYMSMSLDGFITGPDDNPGQGLGRGGERLHAWLGDGGGGVSGFRPSGASGAIFDELMATGAVVVGRRTFDLAGRWGGDHHGVPIFIPTRGRPPAPASDLVHYVTDGVESAMRQAKEAAGEADVLVHGADLAQSCLRAGVLDELEIHLIPVLLGDGRRLFEHLGAEHIELELTRVVDAPGVTHLRYRVTS